MNYRRVWDPLYGRTQLSEFEGSLLSLPEVQRLRYIRMCNINSLLITGASEITRFEHTIGVLRLAQEWSQENAINKTQKNDLIAAAVLHDVLTGPFGHSFQYVLEDSTSEATEFFHEDVARGASENYYMRIPAAAQFAGNKFSAPQFLKERWEHVSKIIDGSGPLGPIIAGTMDLDNLDNVVRLAYHAGLADREDIEAILRVARGIRPRGKSGHLQARTSVVEDIATWQHVRKRLYEFLLLDWADFSAKAMLTRAVERALSASILGTSSWSYTDDGLLSHLASRAIGENQDIADLVRRIRCGDLYWPMWLGRSSRVSLYTELSKVEVKSLIHERIQTTVLREYGMSTKAIFHLILDVGKTERAIKVDIGDGRVVDIGRNSSSLLIGVFLARRWSQGPRLLDKAITRLNALLAEIGLENTEPLDDPMGQGGSSAASQLALPIAEP